SPERHRASADRIAAPLPRRAPPSLENIDKATRCSRPRRAQPRSRSSPHTHAHDKCESPRGGWRRRSPARAFAAESFEEVSGLDAALALSFASRRGSRADPTLSRMINTVRRSARAVVAFFVELRGWLAAVRLFFDPSQLARVFEIDRAL